MLLTFIGPTSSQTMDIDWLEVETNSGSFVIQPGHAPMILLLTPNKEITMGLDDGSTTVITIAGGILEVTRTNITLLLTQE